MIEKFLKPFFWNHHRFRHMTFDELSELYTSSMLRSLAMSMAGIFIPIYLYQHGFAVWEIFAFYCATFALSSIVAVPLAYLIAAIGPKHVILASYFLQIITLLGLIYIERVPSYFLLAVPFSLASLMYFLPYHIDFSKVKHKRKSGQEVGWGYIMERLGAVGGPLIGGLVAYLFAPEYVFVVAIAVLLAGWIPLFFSTEPVRTRQKISFSGFRLRKIKFDLLSQSFFTIETAVSMVVWPFFIGLFVFKDQPYVQIGIITSISIGVSIFAARIIGKIVDEKKGRTLLRFSATANAGLHLVRPFTNGFANALAINIANDTVTPGYRMPYIKGWYDAADYHPGYRIVYMTVVEISGTLSRSIFFGLAALGAYFITADKLFFGVLFATGALASLLIMLERYPALNPGRRKLFGL